MTENLITKIIDDIRRGEASSLDAYLKTVEHAVDLEETQTKFYAHMIQLDGNGGVRSKDFIEFIARHIIQYVIPRSKILEADERDKKAKMSTHLMRLRSDAAKLFLDATPEQRNAALQAFLVYRGVANDDEKRTTEEDIRAYEALKNVPTEFEETFKRRLVRAEEDCLIKLAMDIGLTSIHQKGSECKPADKAEEDKIRKAVVADFTKQMVDAKVLAHLGMADVINFPSPSEMVKDPIARPAGAVTRTPIATK